MTPCCTLNELCHEIYLSNDPGRWITISFVMRQRCFPQECSHFYTEIIHNNTWEDNPSQGRFSVKYEWSPSRYPGVDCLEDFHDNFP